MKRSDLLECLPPHNQKFKVKDLQKKLIEKGFSKEVKGNRIYRHLDQLVQNNILIKLDLHNYKVVDLNNVLDSARDLMNKCESDNKVSFWESGRGLFSKSHTEFAILGMKNDYKMNEWQKQIFDILSTRIVQLFDALRLLLDSQASSPKIESSYVRQFVLELLPFYLGYKAGSDHDGLNDENLYEEMKRIVRLLRKDVVMHIEDQEDLEKALALIKTWNKTAVDECVRYKKAKKFGMIILPAPHLLNPEESEFRDILKTVEDELKGKHSPEKIAAILYSWHYHDDIMKILTKYDGYYSKQSIKKIKDLLNKIQLGYNITYCLYDIDFCLKIIDGYKTNGLRSGFYDSEGNYYGRKNPSTTTFLNDGFFARSTQFTGVPQGADRLIGRGEFRLRTKSYYEEILEETKDYLSKSFRDYGIENCLRAAFFASRIKLILVLRFELKDLNLERILKEVGQHYNYVQVENWLSQEKIQVIEFVSKWIGHHKKQYDYLFDGHKVEREDFLPDLRFEELSSFEIMQEKILEKQIADMGIDFEDHIVYSRTFPLVYDKDFAKNQLNYEKRKNQFLTQTGRLVKIGGLIFKGKGYSK